ncbi:MAG: hypothetical protein ACEQR6_03955 [Burkholderiaceae bacterium]
MRLFILTSSKFEIPRALLSQKVLDIIKLGLSSPQIHFYIVGDNLPEQLLVLEQNNDAVTIIKEIAAEKLIKEVTNAAIIHFGAGLKGSDQFPHYFIALTQPGFIAGLPTIHKWSLTKAFKNCLKKSIATYAINEWAFDFLKNKYKRYTNKIHEAYLPLTNLPFYEWVALADAKNSLTDGANYFLAFQPMNGIVDMLKEFSIFKKWQQTNMALVFIVENDKEVAQARALLTGYKFKESIFIKSISKMEPAWIAASYVILFNSINFDKTILIEMAIEYDIPLLFNNTENQSASIPSSWQQAGEQFSFEEKGGLSNHFKLYYKDELYLQGRARMGKQWLSDLYAKKKNAGLVNIPLTLKSS